MSNKANKQRMKRRLIDALCRHDPDLDFERAVMGDQFRLMRMTHKQLKLMLRLGAKYSHVNNYYLAIDGVMIVCKADDKEHIRKRRRQLHLTTSVSR